MSGIPDIPFCNLKKLSGKNTSFLICVSPTGRAGFPATASSVDKLVCPQVFYQSQLQSSLKPRLDRLDLWVRGNREPGFREWQALQKWIRAPGSLTVRPCKWAGPQKERIIFQPSCFSGELLNCGVVYLQEQNWKHSPYQQQSKSIFDTWCSAPEFHGYIRNHIISATV